MLQGCQPTKRNAVDLLLLFCHCPLQRQDNINRFQRTFRSRWRWKITPCCSRLILLVFPNPESQTQIVTGNIWDSCSRETVHSYSRWFLKTTTVGFYSRLPAYHQNCECRAALITAHKKCGIGSNHLKKIVPCPLRLLQTQLPLSISKRVNANNTEEERTGFTPR